MRLDLLAATLTLLVASTARADEVDIARGYWRTYDIGRAVTYSAWALPVVGLTAGFVALQYPCPSPDPRHGCQMNLYGPAIAGFALLPVGVAVGSTISTSALGRLHFRPPWFGLIVAWGGVGLFAVTLFDFQGDGSAELTSYGTIWLGLALQGAANAFVRAKPEHRRVTWAPVPIGDGWSVQVGFRRKDGR